MKLTIVGNNDASLDEVEFVVCVRSTEKVEFFDNVHGVCSICGVGIQWRPHVPAKPKICLACFDAVAREDTNPEALITRQTADDVLRYLRKRRD